MKRSLLFIAFTLAFCPSAFASFTMTEICHGSHGGGGSAATTATCTGTATAGHTVVMLAQNEGSGTISASDAGGSTWVNKTIVSNGGNRSQLSYTLSQAGSGSTLYTTTWNVSTGGSIIVVDVTATGAISYDSLDVQGTGTSTAADSGANVTTTGTDEVVFAGVSNENNPTISSMQINGVAATSSTAEVNAVMFWKTFGATLTSQHATATVTPSDKWLVPVIAFKAAGGGGTTCTGALLLLGAGGC